MDYCIKCDVQMIHTHNADICPNCGHSHKTVILFGDMAQQFNESQEDYELYDGQDEDGL